MTQNVTIVQIGCVNGSVRNLRGVIYGSSLVRLVLQEAEAAVLLLVVGRAVDDHLLQASYKQGKIGFSESRSNNL